MYGSDASLGRRKYFTGVDSQRFAHGAIPPEAWSKTTSGSFDYLRSAYVRDAQDVYRTATAEEILTLARRVLVRRVRRGVTFSDPSVAKDFLRLKPPGAVDVRALSNPQH
ncbi:hypothetical protein [Luteimonas salinilitoris]|uniref:Uncharacterized protein n=1 Tax=Luteimonas salinilitoris TaxID=3237697 RepID=A0ABV4HYE3_9GAMM